MTIRRIAVKVSAAEFKAKCLKIMDQVNSYHNEVIITKHGKPVAKMVPCNSKASKSMFGFMKDSVSINEDIIKPVDSKWNAD